MEEGGDQKQCEPKATLGGPRVCPAAFRMTSAGWPSGIWSARASPGPRRRSERATRGKLLPPGEKTMVGWDGIEPPTRGFSDLGPCSCKLA